MASPVPPSSLVAASAAAADGQTSPLHADVPHAGASRTLRPQFTVRGLLLATGLIACVLGLYEILGPTPATICLWFLALVAAHVAGNYRGTRQRGQAVAEAASGRPSAGPAPRLRAPQRLQQRQALGWLAPGLSLLGALVASASTAVGLGLLSGFALPWPGVALAAGSAAVLGGFFGFLLSSFLLVSFRALREGTSVLPPRRRR